MAKHHSPDSRRMSPLWSLLLAGALVLAAAAPALALRSSGASDAGLGSSQGRQQALERALSGAVFSEAKAMTAAGKPSEARLNALRAQLAPHGLDYVLSYQELVAKDQPEAEGQQKAPEGQKAQPAQSAQAVELELEVEVNRQALRNTLIRLGFFASPQICAAKAGPGVVEKDLKALDGLNVLLGLTRVAQGTAPDACAVSLERLPQGYFKAVLRQGQNAIAADASELSALWLDVWGRRYADLYAKSGPELVELAVAGFSSVDAANEFARLLSGWDEAVQDSRLSSLDMDGLLVSARFTCRVVSQEALDARLGPALASRKLNLVGQAPVGQGGRK